MHLCQPVVLTGLNRLKPGKIEFRPASGINLCNFSRFKPWFKPGGLNHLPTLDWARPDSAEQCQAGPDGPDKVRQDWIGMGRTVPDRARPGSARQRRIGQRQAGSGGAKQGSSRQDRAEQSQTGSHEAGQDRVRQGRAGQRQTGLDKVG